MAALPVAWFAAAGSSRSPGGRGRRSFAKPWQRRASPLARTGLLAYTLLLIDASLYPWVGWRDRGIGLFDYLRGPWPAYFTSFDVVVNVLGYVPLTMLAALAVYPRWRGAAALAGALAYGVLLSAGLEAAQTLLPARVASLLDLATNAAGALIGAVLGTRLAPAFLDRGRLRELRLQWFERDASLGLVVVALWFAALLYPDVYPFAPGGVLKPVVDAVLAAFDWQESWRLDPAHFVWGEAVLAVLSIGGAGALLLAQARPFAPRLAMALAFVVLSILAQTISAVLSAATERPFAWFTQGAQLGVLGALALLAVQTRLPLVWRARIGLFALTGLVLVTGLLPANPYFAAQPAWAYGQFLNLHGLTFGIHLVWPLFALAALLRPAAGAAARPL